MIDARFFIAAGLALFVLSVLLAHHLFHHVRSHRAVRREAAKWGWGEGRQIHEIRALKRRHGIQQKLRRRRR